ncbi:polysaccharide deacetylase family protein [Actinobacteria bacterium YIM 96077]|uniref:Polysaccharide deacetylase family protein n=1 Tax=Phytoactinopolyspora halophila TaxID=1981511 RepID=A0A329R016_9ACTN|nr:polysaccharide deacetylase family protein [Phytoactinopolyspora halophila]AYY13267.1 polysaccharide deacetylase family protein [Actinobacteria bacterium YIM 96077]RAW17496.1 polysaccharide deacetylase family protein [Phytoactinopolyspora halophila]
MKIPGPVLVGVVVGLLAFAWNAGDSDADSSAGPSDTASETDGSNGTVESGNDDTQDIENGDNAGDTGHTGGSGDGGPPDTGGPNAAELPGGSSDDEQTVILTFDDGPHPVHTPQILDLLVTYDATAVFCVVGERVREHPELVRKIASRGHALCNHTYSHDHDLADRTPRTMDAEIADTIDAIADATPDADVSYFRQPGTHVTAEVAPIVTHHGLDVLDWTVDPHDRDRPGALTIIQRVFDGLESGSVVRLHDGGGDRSQMVRALTQLLPALDRIGYETSLP